MSNKVDSALDKRKKRAEDEYEQSQKKVSNALAAREKRIQGDLSNTLTSLVKEVNYEIDAYKNATAPTYGENVLKNTLDTTRESRVNVQNLKKKVEAYRKYIGDERADDIIKTLDLIYSGYDSHLSSAELMSQYETEEDYNKAVEANKDYQGQLTFDLEAGAKEIEDLEAQLAKLPTPNYDQKGDTGQKAAEDAAKKRENLEKLIAEKKAYYNQAKYIQEGAKLAGVANPDSEWYDPNFSKYAEAGKAYYDEKHPDNPALPSINFDKKGWSSDTAEKMDAYTKMLDSFDYTNMTDEERQIYHYYLGKAAEEAEANGGEVSEEMADRYVHYIKEAINARHAQKMAAEINSEGKLTQLFFAAYSGIENWATGIENNFKSDDYIPTTATAYASQLVREDMKNDGFGWGVAYDLTNTVSNMFPSIALSYVPVAGQALSLTSFWASASGHAYAEAINSGYDKSQARTYSMLVGGSEAGLQYLLGGISRLGGKLSGNVTNKIAAKLSSNIGNAYARITLSSGAKLVGHMASEFSEEYLQDVLTPVYKNIALNTDEDVKFFSTDALYAGFLGALSAGLLEGGSIVGSDIDTYKTGNRVIEAGQKINLAELGKTFSADTVAYKIASKVDENTDAYTLGQLLHEVGADSLSASNIADITTALVNEGMALENAQTIAKWLNKAVEGGYFTMSQRSALEDNEIIGKVFRDVVLNKDSSVNQRVQGYQDVLQGIENGSSSESLATFDNSAASDVATENIENVAKQYEAMGLSPEEAKAMAMAQLSTTSQGESAPTKENAVEGKYAVADDGKTSLKETGKAVKIKNISGVSKSGEISLTVNDGMVVKASDLAFGSDAEAVIIESIGKIKVGNNPISTASANALYQAAKTALKNNPNMTAEEAMSLIKGLEESYVYGSYNLGRSKLTATNRDGKARMYAGELSQAQRKFAYDLGAKDSAKKVEAKQKTIDDLKAKAKSKTTAPKGKVRFENGVVAKGKLQKRAVSLAKHLARAMGIDIVFYDATTTTNKEGKGANGYFDPKTDTIYLDLQNSWSDAKTIVYTMSHELVHFIKKWSPEKFKTLADFLMKHYGKNGVDVSALLSKKMTELGTKDADLAYEEMIADACETMLLDSNAVVKLMELRKTDLELFDKIKLFINNLLNKIRSMYKKLGLNPTSDEAKALLGMKNVLEKMYSLFEDAVVDAAQSYQAVSTLETDSVSVSEDGTVVMQMKQYQQTGRATLLNYLKEQYGDADANNLISTIDNIYNTMKDIKKDETLSVFSNWQDSEVELDDNGHPIFTTSINNGDYELNQDFSRVCKKRRQLDFVLNMLAEDPAFEASNLTKQDFVKINKAIKEHGFEIACALCFVDSKRFRQAEWADSFANTWNDILYSVVADKSKLTPFNFATKTPNLADDGIEIDTSKPVMYRKWSEGKEDVKNRKNYNSFDEMLSKDGKKWIEGNTNVRTIATLIRDNPSLRHTFRGADIIASQGFDTIQRLAPGIRGILDGWGGSSVPKPSSSDASYDSSIINLSGYNKETAYAMGGARMNSFSDFMAHMFFDYCQAFADLAAKELPSQAYTKELIYVRLFGRSGQKINMSGIAAIRDNALPTTAQKGVSKAEAKANEKIEKMVAGLDVSRLLEHLNKDIHELTEADVEQFLDMCDYVWADESINMKHATLLQTGILYDKLSDSKVEECYELLKAGEIEQALKVAGEANVDTEYAKHCGTIVVGVSDAHIRKLLRDPTVRMVIPYHKSGLNPVIARELRISNYNDYTLAQSTGVKRKGAKATEKIGSDEIKAAYGLKDFSFYDWFGKTIDGKVYDGKATADKYLEWCEKGYYDENVGDYVYYTNKGDGYILAKEFHKKATIVPKFETFVGEENYYKVLEDFDCYNTITGEHSTQGAVDFLRNGLPADYKSVLMDALKAEQKVHDDFRDHLDNKGLKDEIMDIVKANGYKPSIKKQAKKATPIDLSDNNELSKLVEGVHGSKRYKAIAEYIINVLGNEEITLSDGTVAIVDKSDASHIASNAGSSKTRQIAKIKDLVTQAELYAYDNDAKHNKFDQFLYYQAMVRYDNEEFPLYLNVGRGLNDKKYHIYDITKKLRDTANRINGFLRPKPNEGYAIESDISNKRIPHFDNSVKKQLKKSPSYAPTFYSQMGKVVEGVKQEKLAANSVVNMLRGKGVKAEEIRWSGIVPFLEGKKSVTKQELLDFINGSMLQIDESSATAGDLELVEMNNGDYQIRLNDDYDTAITLHKENGLWIDDHLNSGWDTPKGAYEHFKKQYKGETRWKDYTLDGGSNYREIVFTMPNSTYSNRAMRGHWGQDAEGILVHARIQDFDINGKKMLFIEELQSDWHNEGLAKGYTTEEYEDAVAVYDRLVEDYANKRKAFTKYVRSSEFRSDPDDVSKKKFDWLRGKMETAEKRMQEAERNVNALKEKGMGDVPDAPFRSTYHEFVLKRLLRMAAEQGYDSIGWTPAEIQSKRWSYDYEKAYKIEYDQDMPKFLKKYGKQWGAKVGNATISNTEVWSMDIPDSMKESVLYEGQVMYQMKTDSNRSILANSLDSATKNDLEKNKLKEYKEKISLIESEEQRLSEIQKKLFTKGEVDPAQRRELQFEAKQISNRINTYDRQLLNLEATTALKNVLNREKALAMKRQKQKDAEKMREYKEKVAKTTRELIARNQESRKKATEGRNKTAMRHQIQRVVSELNTLLTRGNKKKHVPEDLKIAVADVLELFNMDTVGAEERVAKYNALIAKAKDPDVIASLTETRDRIQSQGDKFNARLSKLKTAYDSIKNSANPEIAGGFDEVISSRIEYVASKVGGTSLRNMTLEQLEMVYDVYTMVLNNIREANALFKKDKAETIQNYASRVVGEVKRAGGEHELTSPRTEGIKGFLWNNLKPIYAFEKIGSNTLTELFEDVRSGEDTWAVDITEAKEFSDSKSEQYNYKKWDFDKKYTFKSSTGEQFNLTLDQILSIYAYSKRPQAGDHLRIGGFVFDDSITTYKEKENGKQSKLKYKVNIASAHQISLDTLVDIVGSLTNEQKAFVDEMQTYLSEVMGEKGNEVSMTLYNVRLFKEKFYFPLKSAKQFMFEQNEVAGEVKIKNAGFTEGTVEHANNPIILNNFMDVWAGHVNDMAMYHSFVVPLENFNRVFNYQTKRAEGMPPVSVKETLQNAYGTHAVSYIRQLLTDLNGGARSDPRESTSKKLISRFKKAKVFASASVVIQQPSAVARALALIDAKYFDYNPKLINHKARWEEVKKYAPVAIIKEMGHFDTDMGMSTVEYIKGQKTLMQKADDVLSKAPSYADELTWVHMWEAVKRETQAKNKDLKVGSEEFLQAAGKRFTEVVTKTQVYDSVLSRSANMRSKSMAMGMITAFLAEPTTAINMVEQGIRLWNRGYKRAALKQLRGVGASVILNAALVSLVYAMRDDDEDETYLEKYLGSFVSEVIDGINPLTYYPIVKDVWSLLQGYDVERTDMSLFSDVIDALTGLAQVLYSYDGDMTEEELQQFKEGLLDNSLKLVDGIAAMFGVPVGNIRRDVESVSNTIKTAQNGYSTSWLSLTNELVESVKNITPVWGWLPDQQKTDKLYEAIISGDTAYVDRLKSGYKDDKAYETAVRKALRENDPRIREAAEARIAGKIAEYTRIVKQIKAEGFFSQDTIVAAINAEINALNKGESSSTSASTTEDKESSIYKIEDYYASIVGGDQASARVVKEDIINTDVANGKDRDEAEESFNSRFTSLVREEFEAGNLSEYEAEKMLINYGGKTKEEATSKVQYWRFKQEYPDYDDLSEEAVDKYYNMVEPYGISVDVYYDYYKQRSKCKGVDANGDGKTDSGSVKAEVLRVINSLPLTKAQKDALYYLNGWSANTLHEAPWR